MSGSLRTEGNPAGPTQAAGAIPDQFVDAHHHVWMRERLPYSWMTGQRSNLSRPHGFDDWMKVASPTPIASVLVQGDQRTDDTVALLAVAARAPIPTVVTGWVDASSSASAAADLDALLDCPDAALLRAVRIQSAAELQVLESRTTRRRLDQHSLMIEALASGDGLREILARRSGSVPLIVDHAGHPHADELPQWRKTIGTIGATDDVFVKVSGIMSPSDRALSGVEAVRILTDLMGLVPARRLMFGSDWPVSSLRLDYGAWRAMVNDAAYRCLDELDRSWLWRDTALDVYRLGGVAAPGV